MCYTSSKALRLTHANEESQFYLPPTRLSNGMIHAHEPLTLPAVSGKCIETTALPSKTATCVECFTFRPLIRTPVYDKITKNHLDPSSTEIEGPELSITSKTELLQCEDC